MMYFQTGEDLSRYSEGHTLLTPGAEKKILSQFLREEERRLFQKGFKLKAI